MGSILVTCCYDKTLHKQGNLSKKGLYAGLMVAKGVESMTIMEHGCRQADTALEQ